MRKNIINFFILLTAVSIAMLPGFIWGFGHIRPNGENEKDIMTMLAIIIGTMALFGAGAYAIIYVFIKDQFNQEIKKMQFYTKAQTLKALGVIEYYRFLDDHKNGEKERASHLLITAEKDMSDALDAATELYKLEPNKDHDLLLCILKNNMACIIVRKKDKERKFEALEYIKYAHKRISDYPEHACAWEDTKNMVKKGLFDDAESSEAYREPLKKWARRCLCKRMCR